MKLWIFILLISFSFIQCEKTNFDNFSNLTLSDSIVIDKSNKVGIDFFKKIYELNEEKINIASSTLSIQMAFAMAANGASGKTLEEICKLFDIHSSQIDSLNLSMNRLLGHLNQSDDSKSIKLKNAFFYDKNRLQIDSDYIKNLTSHFEAHQSVLNFDNTQESLNAINSWVSDQTAQKITKVLDNIQDEEIMFLINALYFKANWDQGFPLESTIDEDFYLANGTKIAASTMTERNHYLYAEVGQLQCVSLPCGNNSLEALFIMPKDGNIDQLISKLTASQIKLIEDELLPKDIQLFIPKFKFKNHIDLKPVCESFDIHTPFTSNASFEKMGTSTGIIYLTRATHDTYIGVDEKGIEGAAVTTIGVGVTSLPPDVRFNKPFLLIVKDKKSKVNLMMIKVGNPQLENN